MTQTDPPTQSSTCSNCNPMFTAGSVTLVLDAPQKSIATQPLPANFRPMQISGISGSAASGSAEFSLSQFQAMLAKIGQEGGVFPLVVVDLRQEPHGFLTLKQPLNGETEVAVGWFAERDWLNVAKGVASLVVDEENRLAAASQTANLEVYDVLTKCATEDGICTATPCTVNPTSYRSEKPLVKTFPGVDYLRLPTTDHCRPRDAEVDQFVAYEATLDPKTWLHFHCRASDGRTTSFMAMHDIIHNAPCDSLETILTRQGPSGIGGVDLSKVSDNPDVFSYPFSAERVTFIQDFYSYVVDAKPGGFKLKWSDWVLQTRGQKSLAA